VSVPDLSAPARRPLIAVPGRFSASASALRYAALVNARALLDGVLRAGGEPLTVLPTPLGSDRSDRSDRADRSGSARSDAEIGERLGWADGVLLPGGGDLDPARYGQVASSAHVYDVDPVQDGFDLAVARWALATGVPLLAVCRGLQVVNVALGGTLVQHMDVGHRHHVHQVPLAAGETREALGPAVTASCYHHQRIDRLGTGLRVVGSAQDGTIEAVELPPSAGWFLGVQWHPEDTAATDPVQQRVFDALVRAARARRSGVLAAQTREN
jgi:putative glutamine amidotransferase